MKKLATTLVSAIIIAVCLASSLAEEATPKVASAEIAPKTEVWMNGQSPEQPYKGVPPVDLTQKLGYMMLNPINNSNVDTPIDALRIYLPREDAVGGEGMLRLYEEGVDAPLEEISLADTSKVTLAPIDAESLAWLYWESGNYFTIKLSRALNIDKTYSVSIDENAIVVPEYGIGNPVMAGKTGWSFTTNADAGVIDVVKSGGAVPKVGDTLTIHVKYGGDAQSAAIYTETDAIEVSMESPAENGALYARYAQAGEVAWSVVLLGEDGQILARYNYGEVVEPK